MTDAAAGVSTMNALSVNKKSLFKKDAWRIADRSVEEQVVLALCVTGFLGILPFAIFRLAQAEWLLGFIDILLLSGVFLIGYYVWATRITRAPSIILTLFYMTGMVTVIYIKGPSLLYWAYPTMAAAYFLIKPKEAATTNVVAMLAIMPALAPLQGIEGSTVLITLVLNNMFSYIFSKRMLVHASKLRSETTRDTLTKTGNRKSFCEKSKETLAWYQRKNQVSSMMVLDIDHFKDINDQQGHLVGDEILVKLARLIQIRLRLTDQFFRFGGDEFVIILADTKIEFATSMADELRELVNRQMLAKDTPLTLSIGVADCTHARNEHEWFEQADKALYQAKKSGRNQVVSA